MSTGDCEWVLVVVEVHVVAAAAGSEPWVTWYPPEELTGILTRHCFSTITHVRQADTLERRARTRTDALHPMEFSALVHATV